MGPFSKLSFEAYICQIWGIAKTTRDSSKLKIQNIIVKIVVMDHILEAKGFGSHQFPPLSFVDIFGNHKDIKSRDTIFTPICH